MKNQILYFLTLCVFFTSVSCSVQNIKVSSDMPRGILKPEHELKIDEINNTISISLQKCFFLNVLVEVENPKDSIKLNFTADSTSRAFSLLRNQGLFIKYDNDNSWSRVDFVPIDSNQYRITIAAKPKIQVSISIPYSSADVDKLATLVSGNKNINIRTLGVEPRTFKIFDFGKDDGKKPIHYFIAGEDLFETASMWTADAMIRYLTDNPDVLAEITAHHILRIVPAMSPYSLNKTNNYSFLDDDDNPIYGAATWGDDLPAGELKYMRNEVVGIFPPSTEPSYLNSKRLHWVLNMHSWWAQANYTNLQASNKTKSGVTLIDNENSSRQKWLEDFLISNIEGIPRKHYEISTTWRAGLPRDYFLAKYNFITSVIEVCTYKQGMPEFTATGQAIINNLKNKGNDYDWSKLYAPKE